MASETNDRPTAVTESGITQRTTPTVVVPPTISTPEFTRSSFKKATDFLSLQSRIGFVREKYEKYRRYAHLNKNEMFSQLVALFKGLFIIHWPAFRRFMEQWSTDLQGAPTLQDLATRVYISHWFIDLYVSNRESVRKLSPLAFAEHYTFEIVHNSDEYDAFLSQLNAIIRPTHIQLSLEDTLYIPIINDTVNWNTPNPFEITNFIVDLDIFCGLISIMKSIKAWNMSPLSSHILGKPTWLFDWHENQAFTWFPMEGNFNEEDVMMAYIIGVACTPKLAPRDVDDWQVFPNNTPPINLVITDYQRIVGRRFYGSAEACTLEVDVWTPEVPESPAPKGKQKKQTAKKAKTGEPSGPKETSAEEGQIVYNRFRITNWCYHGIVIERIDQHTRTGALRMIVLSPE